MKRSFLYLFLIASMLIIATGDLVAQDFEGGVVKYQQTTKYDWQKIFNPEGNARPGTQQWLTSLPREIKKFHILSFTENAALYEEDPDENIVLSGNIREALGGARARKPPTPELKKVFYDFGKNEKTEQLEFMTRDFLISESIKSNAWKLTNKKIKVQNYVCQTAELKKGEDTITAMFSPEIPVSAGPDEYFGLPGLILAIEINGETAFMATSVNLTPPKKGALSKPDDGKKVTREELDKTIEEKVKEYKENRSRGRDRKRREIREIR